jgi:hypothetical protein
MMIVKIDPSGLKETAWHEYAVRFIFGGLITAHCRSAGKGVGTHYRWPIPRVSRDFSSECDVA